MRWGGEGSRVGLVREQVVGEGYVQGGGVQYMGKWWLGEGKRSVRMVERWEYLGMMVEGCAVTQDWMCIRGSEWKCLGIG